MENTTTQKQSRRASDMRRFRIGGFGVLITVAFLAALVIFYMVINALPATWTHFDLTSGLLYSVSDDTLNLLGKIERDVTLYLVSTPSERDENIVLFLDKYKNQTEHVKVVFIDPEVRNSFVQKYTDSQLTPNSVIIESDLRSSVVDYGSFYEYTVYYNGSAVGVYDYDTMMQFYGEYASSFESGELTYVRSSFCGENSITSAIDYVTIEKLPKLYCLEGHGELSLSSLEYIPAAMSENSITSASLNLANTKTVPEDADCVLIYSPGSDISGDEKTALADYLASGGNIILLTAPGCASFENLAALTSSYGMSAEDGVVSDPTDGYHYWMSDVILTPVYGTHRITANAAGYTSFVYYAHAISASAGEDSALNVTKLLNTSDKSLLNPLETDDDTTGDGSEDEEEDGDSGETAPEPASYCIAAIGEKTDENGTKSALLWIPSANFISDSYLGNGNVFMFTDALESLTDKATSVQIASKSLASESLEISNTAVKIIATIVCGVLPVGFIVGGIIVFVRRKKR